MNTIIVISMGLAMLATLGALLLGLIGMVRGGPGSGERSNKYMRLRVFFQAVALGLFALSAIMAAA